MNLDTNTIPPELARRMVEIGKIEWGAIKAKTDEEIIADFADSLRRTREKFKTPDGPQSLHGTFLIGSETVLCLTGTSPNSPVHAQIIAGLWNSVIDALMATPEPESAQ